ncbi:hypothetical protein F5Y17DRAFT_35890 [Xylariaceae sp. FL0594]|nr:hypothetical protein F5Y17DRAFT_35890 [Xylariaceae sp. FL0594]
MSSPMYTVSPASLHDLSDYSNHNLQHHQSNATSNGNYNHGARRVDGQAKQAQNAPITPESHLLSPYSSHTRGDSSSPSLSTFTPADTVCTPEGYPVGDIFTSDLVDPFVGANFEDVLGNAVWGDFNAGQVADHELNLSAYPISPHQTPAFMTGPVFNTARATTATLPALTTTEETFAVAAGLQHSDSPQQDFSVQQEHMFDSSHSSSSDAQFTTESNRESWSSNGSPGHGLSAMVQSPRVMVSVWGKEDGPLIQGVERAFVADSESPRTVRPSHSLVGDLANPARVARDACGGWVANPDTGHRGLAPAERLSDEVPSINQGAADRELKEKNREVSDWIRSSGDEVPLEAPAAGIDDSQGPEPEYTSAADVDDEIPLGHNTENRHRPGVPYFMPEAKGPFTKTDFDLMRYLPSFHDAPTVHAIHSPGKPPAMETAQAAMAEFNRLCDDNASVVSKAATWGTRRLSLNDVDIMEDFLSGNILRKLTIRDSASSRRKSFLQRFPSLRLKQGSIGGSNRKRNRSNASELPPEEPADPNRRESKDSLAPPSRSLSQRKPKSTPSLNMALVGITQSVAVIGTHHARSPSMSATTATPSSRTMFPSLSVPQLGRRQRSNSDLPKSSPAEVSHPNLITMLRQQGGLPVTQFNLQPQAHPQQNAQQHAQRRAQPHAQPHAQVEVEDEEDDEDDGMDEADLAIDAENPAIEATFDGFKAHILRLNPSLAGTDGAPGANGYLVDRIAQQMYGRYKHLLLLKQNHIKAVQRGDCPSRFMCEAAGAGVRYLDSRGGDRSVGPLSARPLSSDEEGAPVEGGISAESFPPGIPKPQPNSLPAEFECKVCFACKKFQKPSDWTKHMHEDVQPFTCTWEKCRDAKMFKRKADWVRHENEGHRHLEWWACDVEECRHTCYRRDNFLQHLVREHKFPEPKVKTKAAVKKAGGVDQTWQKVEQCHHETSKRPTEEPCRFCGKTFATWKKLTVHLAKHMELISLPVLGLVFEKELDSDTVISPVRDPPPRTFPPPPTTPSLHVPQATAAAGVSEYRAAPNLMEFSPVSQAPMRSPYYTPAPVQQYPDMRGQADNMMLPQQFATQARHFNTALPVTTAPYTQASGMYPTGLSIGDTEPFPAFDPLGIPTDIADYQALGHPAMHTVNVDQFGVNAGSASPYTHSPHPGHNGPFYNA